MQLLALLVTCTVAQVTLPQSSFQLDYSFSTGLVTRYVVDVLPVENGKALISGPTTYSGENILQPRYGVRLNSDGSRDLAFNPYPSMGGRMVRWVDRFYSGAGQTVRRLFMDGFRDTTFISMNLGRYFLSLQGGDYHVYSDGRVLMSGAHVLSDSVRGFEGLYSLIWFSNEGYLDTTRTHRLCNGVIYWIHEQTDGRILCTGTMTTYEGQPVSRVFRVEVDGSLDPSFSTPFQPWGGSRDYFELPDGRILLGGTLKINGSDTVRCMLRVFPNGDLDPSYTLNTFDALHTPTNSPAVLSIYELSPDRYIITGVFDKINGQDRGGIAMIDSSGNLVQDVFDGMGCGAYEYAFSGGSTTYKYIAGIVPSNDGGFFIHGGYHGYDDGTTNDTTQRMVSKLYGLDVGVVEHPVNEWTIYPNPGTDRINVQSSTAPYFSRVEFMDPLGRVVLNTPLVDGMQVDVRSLPSGLYVVRLVGKGSVTSTSRWVKE